jgi:hypothetical protein
LADVTENPFPEPIRVNLPGSEDSFRTGNGEGCWATVSVSTKQIDDSGKWGGAYVALLENAPIYPQWRSLEYGSPVVFQFRGPNKRAVAYPDQDKALKEAQSYGTRFVRLLIDFFFFFEVPIFLFPSGSVPHAY